MTAITTGTTRSEVDRFPVILAAALLFSFAVMPGAVTPGIIGAAAETFQWPESRLGIFASMFFAGFGLSGRLPLDQGSKLAGYLLDRYCTDGRHICPDGHNGKLPGIDLVKFAERFKQRIIRFALHHHTR